MAACGMKTAGAGPGGPGWGRRGSRPATLLRSLIEAVADGELQNSGFVLHMKSPVEAEE